jgi:hypothetical protein
MTAAEQKRAEAACEAITKRRLEERAAGLPEMGPRADVDDFLDRQAIAEQLAAGRLARPSSGGAGGSTLASISPAALGPELQAFGVSPRAFGAAPAALGSLSAARSGLNAGGASLEIDRL